MTRTPLENLTAEGLDQLYARLEAAESVTRRIPHAAHRIREALEQLPEQCRYHRDRLDPDHLSRGREACCDTGVPSRRRRVALDALDGLTAPPPDTCPDTGPDTVSARGGALRTGVLVGESPDCGPLPTSTDTARTPPDTDTGQGVRVEYRATVPRYLLGAALAEALGAIDDATRTPPPGDAPPDHA
ncbi:hypothetical protein ACGFR8_07730 [Streptomyces brevispora]|uniref:hypothetical protein n=1 Tax=Streptomyces brevispora TaxID=887462 RepID=UPI003723AAAA